MYTNDNRIVMTLDAGGTNLVFSAIRGGEEIVTPITLPSCACHLDQCLGQLLDRASPMSANNCRKPR